MRHMDFTLCLDDLGVCMRPSNKSDIYPYYEYVLLYTYYALLINENVEATPRNDLGS